MRRFATSKRRKQHTVSHLAALDLSSYLQHKTRLAGYKRVGLLSGHRDGLEAGKCAWAQALTTLC